MGREEKLKILDDTCNKQNGNCVGCPLAFSGCTFRAEWPDDLVDHYYQKIKALEKAMVSKELKTKMDKLCDEQGDSCFGCPCRDFDVCNIAEEGLTDEDYAKGVEALESLKEAKVGESTTDASKVPLHATHEPTQGSEYDVVSRPQHYASTSIECIDAMRETQGDEAVKDFCVCNAFKYLWRHNSKNGDEDVRKASWYLNKAVEIMDCKST